ncbi:MAG: hypothetical protein IKR81_15410, partial [Victivallales bacterium]|nr:hypothetical protein [Victivallales bacterium]
MKARHHTPLQVELYPSAPSVLPGSEVTVNIKVATADGTPAKASLVFAMYDSSLDAVMKRKSNLANAFVLPPLRYEVNDVWEAEALRTALWLSTACGDYVPIGPLLHSRLLWFDTHEPPMTTDNKVWERLCNLEVQTRYMAEEYDFYDEEDSRYSTHRTRRRWSPLLFLSKEEMIQWRKEFLDTAFWRTGIVTDENGCAKVTLKLPDNLTTWRARVWAATQDFHYGEGTCHVTATKDTLIRPMLPDFLIEGDTIALGEAVHNFTAKTVTTAAKAEFDDHIRLLNPAKIPLELPARSAQTALWNVKAEKPGTAQVKLSATGDGVETSLPILPLEAENALSFNTILFPQSPEHVFTFEIPPTAISETPHIIADNGYDLHGRIGQARDYLINYEYNCTEQLSNRIIGILATQKANYELQPSDKKLLLTAISILEKRQKDDGSWAWFSQGKGELCFTCFALRALLAANENGLTPNQLALQKSLFFLQKHASLISGEEIDKPAWENPYSSHRNNPLG